MGFAFEVRSLEVDESFPSQLTGAHIAEYICNVKARAHLSGLAENEILITADTVVCLGQRVYNKPLDQREAISMLSALSGKVHQVITAMSLVSKTRESKFHETTHVKFAALTLAEIEYYVTTYSPFDKAGGYGIQEWIGQIGIESITGSYFNVVGLPTHRFYQELKNFLTWH